MTLYEYRYTHRHKHIKNGIIYGYLPKRIHLAYQAASAVILIFARGPVTMTLCQTKLSSKIDILLLIH